MRRNRLLTLCAALWLAISPAMAVTYAVRNNTRLTRTGTAPAFASTWTVTVYENGAIATANSTGTTITVASGHGFTAGDKLMVGTDTSTYRTVSSTGATSVVVNSAVTATTGAFILNLGADTGVASPSYDGSTVSIYQYSDGTGAYTSSRVTLDSQGRYGYWVDDTLTVMELFRNSAGTPDSVQFVTISGSGGGGGAITATNSCTTDRAVTVMDGTGGDELTCPPATISSTGTMTLAQAATPVSGDNATMTVTANDGSNSSTEITYTTSGSVVTSSLQFRPRWRVGNAAATVIATGIYVDGSDYLTGDIDYLYGFRALIQPNTLASSGTKYLKSSVEMAGMQTDFVLDGQVSAHRFPLISGYSTGITDDAGSGTSDWLATDYAGYRLTPASTTGFWSGIATLTRGYGVDIADMPAAGANIANWWGAFLGGPMLVVDNSSGGAAQDDRGWLAWGTDKSRWLDTVTDVTGDGTTDSSNYVNAAFRWNNDTPRFEFGIHSTTAMVARAALSRSGTTTTFAATTTDDVLRLGTTDTTLGAVYLDVDSQNSTPRIHTNVGIVSDSSTTLLNGIQDAAMNEDSQSVTCSAGSWCIQDSDSSATDEVTYWEGTAPGTFGAQAFRLEGATNDGSEVTLATADASADSTITLPRQTTGRVPVVLYNQAANVTVNGAASATLVSTTNAAGTPTLPANFLDAIAKGFVVDAYGVLTTDASPAAITWLVQIGSVSASTSGALTGTASMTNVGWQMHVVCTARSVGSGTSATVLCQGGVTTRGNATTPVAAYWDMPATAASSGFDSTATQLIDVEVNAGNGDSVTLTNLTITSIW